jgi:ribosomal 50S subunit-associated protein YjgA (DUF615 family)
MITKKITTTELRGYLDGLNITSYNLNKIREKLYIFENSDWNDIVDGETSARCSRPLIPLHDETIKYTQDELIQLCKSIEKLTKNNKRFCIDYGYDNAVEVANSLEIKERNRANHNDDIISKMEIDREELAKKYDELIYAVGRKYPNESRHQTALRYIINSEKEDITNYTDVRKP